MKETIEIAAHHHETMITLTIEEVLLDVDTPGVELHQDPTTEQQAAVTKATADGSTTTLHPGENLHHRHHQGAMQGPNRHHLGPDRPLGFRRLRGYRLVGEESRAHYHRFLSVVSHVRRSLRTHGRVQRRNGQRSCQKKPNTNMSTTTRTRRGQQPKRRVRARDSLGVVESCSMYSCL